MRAESTLKAGFYYFPLEQLSLEVMLGNLFVEISKGKIEEYYSYTDDPTSIDSSDFYVNFSAANTFRFDELIRLNYYF
mgnify:CR=1 FL=1